MVYYIDVFRIDQTNQPLFTMQLYTKTGFEMFYRCTKKVFGEPEYKVITSAINREAQWDGG